MVRTSQLLEEVLYCFVHHGRDLDFTIGIATTSHHVPTFWIRNKSSRSQLGGFVVGRSYAMYTLMCLLETGGKAGERCYVVTWDTHSRFQPWCCGSFLLIFGFDRRDTSSSGFNGG